MKLKLILSSSLVLAIIAIAINSSSRDESYIVHQSMWNIYAPEIERSVREYMPVSLDHISGAIASHHIPTAIPQLVELYSRIGKTQTVENIIIIGPDHINAGMAPITVSSGAFQTTYSTLLPIKGLAEKLKESGIANIEEDIFDPEHSIGSQILVISKIFPKARITPIILRSDTTKRQAEALSQYLSEVIDEKTILIASVDFSHYMSTNQALPIDTISGDVIKNLDLDSISLVEADSNKSIYVFVNTMKRLHADKSSDVNILNTNDLMQNSDYTTGYIFGYWGR